jgi:SAM-dependent methyltransferase
MAFEFKYYWNTITDHISFFIDEESSVLEIGCRSGQLTGSLPGHDKTGIDADAELIGRAITDYPDSDFYVMAASQITFNRKFDIIILSNVIGQLQDVQSVLNEIHKLSHPSTRIIIIYYNFLWEPVLKFAELIGLKKKIPDQNWLSRKDISNLLALSGFETYRESTDTIMPVYIPLISRFVNAVLAKLPLMNNLGINNYSFSKPVPGAALNTIHLPSVSVIVPARNERGNISQLVRRLPLMGEFTELIFIEGGSHDETWNTIQEVLSSYPGKLRVSAARQDGTGKNNAVRKGFEMASGDVLMILDADLTVSPEDLPRFYHILSSGKADFVNGCRLVYPMKKQAMRLLNLFGNKVFGVIFSWLLEQPVKDTLCGTKAMWRKDYLKLDKNRSYFGDFDPFGDFDLLFGAYKLNLKIVDLPVQYHERTYGSTNISRIKHGWLLFKMCCIGAMKIKFR